MPEIPDEAVKAAAEAMREVGRKDPWLGVPVEDTARAALEAAAPILAEHVAQKITAHADRRPKVLHGTLGAWHRHFGIAARIAAGAFSTREDNLKAAAKAIAAGNFVACSPDDEGR